ncbi:MAG: hypothetical protein CFE31_01935 [Rhizobiales bacterium PAR1]|nr:MAG: hypothetical protein CFE31_01935 [Rhizobiales bacterium PAR1]
MRRIKEFWKDRRGATTVVMALAMVPVMSILGIATDYAKATSQRNALQQAIDAAAIAIAKDPDANLISNADLKARAVAYANAAVGNSPVDNMSMTVSIDADRATLSASGTVKLNFGAFLGADTLTVASTVTVELSKMKNVEIALVLDNTGSMGGSKINELKKAVKALIDFFEPRIKNPDDVKIALVPFTNVVRTNSSWMQSWMLKSTPPNNWQGCVQDRNAPYDITDQPPSAGVGDSLYPVTSSCGGLAEIIPMTNNLTAIRAAADTMIASGSTDVPLGIAWGWHALSNGVPLTQGSPDSTPNVMRVMVVLTDGENTAHRWANDIDARMNLVCSNVKAQNITVFTVRVLDGNQTLLRNCATSTAHYFNVTNASQLTPVFEQIAQTMSKLRISK